MPSPQRWRYSHRILGHTDQDPRVRERRLQPDASPVLTWRIERYACLAVLLVTSAMFLILTSTLLDRNDARAQLAIARFPLRNPMVRRTLESKIFTRAWQYATVSLAVICNSVTSNDPGPPGLLSKNNSQVFLYSSIPLACRGAGTSNVPRISIDIVMFDVPAPLQAKGIEEYKNTWELFFDNSPGGPGSVRCDGVANHRQ